MNVSHHVKIDMMMNMTHVNHTHLIAFMIALMNDLTVHSLALRNVLADIVNSFVTKTMMTVNMNDLSIPTQTTVAAVPIVPDRALALHLNRPGIKMIVLNQEIESLFPNQDPTIRKK